MKATVILVALVLGVMIGAPQSAFAAEPAWPDDAFEAEPEREQRWYGWQTLTSDAIALSLAALTTTTEQDAGLWGLGVGTFALGAPLVHVGHGRPLVGLGDFGLRLAVPFAGMFIGSRLDRRMDCNAYLDCDRSSDGAVAGGMLGAAVVSALDATLFSYEAVEPERRPAIRAAHIWPGLAVTPAGWQASLAGSFF